MENLSEKFFRLNVPVSAQRLLLNFLAVSVLPELLRAVVRVFRRQENLILIGNTYDNLGLVGHLLFI